MGAQFTLADIVIVPTIDRLDDLGLARMWDDYRGVARWYERVKSRPSFATAFYPGSRISQSGAKIAALPT